MKSDSSVWLIANVGNKTLEIDWNMQMWGDLWHFMLKNSSISHDSWLKINSFAISSICIISTNWRSHYGIQRLFCEWIMSLIWIKLDANWSRLKCEIWYVWFFFSSVDSIMLLLTKALQCMLDRSRQIYIWTVLKRNRTQFKQNLKYFLWVYVTTYSNAID